MCLAQGHNPVNLFGLQPATFRGAALHKEKEIKRERQRESITGSCSEQCSRANTIKCGVEKIFENLTSNMLLTNKLQLMSNALIHWCFYNNNNFI